MGLLDELKEELEWALWDWGKENLKEPHIKLYKKLQELLEDKE